MSSVTYTSQKKVHTLVAVGLFTALAYVCCVLFHFKASFLTFDLKDAVMMIGAMLFGPLYGLAMAVIVALIEMVTVSTTWLYGLIMNIAASASFVCVGSLIYVRRRTMSGAVIAMCSSVVSMTVVMMIANLIITPFYMHAPTTEVVKLIPTLLLPFNLAKAIFNAALVFIFYKPTTTLLRRAGFSSISSTSTPSDSNKPVSLQFIITIIAVFVAVLCLLFFFFVLQGSFQFGK